MASTAVRRKAKGLARACRLACPASRVRGGLEMRRGSARRPRGRPCLARSEISYANCDNVRAAGGTREAWVGGRCMRFLGIFRRHSHDQVSRLKLRSTPAWEIIQGEDFCHAVSDMVVVTAVVASLREHRAAVGAEAFAVVLVVQGVELAPPLLRGRCTGESGRRRNIITAAFSQREVKNSGLYRICSRVAVPYISRQRHQRKRLPHEYRGFQETSSHNVNA